MPVQVLKSANWVPAKIIMNGKPVYQLQVEGQITPGYQPVSVGEFLQGAATQVGGYNGETTLLAQMQSDPQKASIIQKWQQGDMNTPSGSVQVKDPITGQVNWDTQDRVDQQNQQDADIASGKLVQVAPGRYAPAGSAATTNPLGVNNAASENARILSDGSGTAGSSKDQQQNPAITKDARGGYSFNGQTYDTQAAAEGAYDKAALQQSTLQLASQFGLQSYIGADGKLNIPKGVQVDQSMVDKFNTSLGQLQIAAKNGEVQYNDPTQVKVNTGNPLVDQIANTYLNTIWSQHQTTLAASPTGVNDDAFNSIVADVDRTLGPSIAAQRQQAEDQYQQQLTQSRAQTDLSKQGIDATDQATNEDTATQQGRINEDTATQQATLGRNLTQATDDTRAHFASAGRTFGGGRISAENKLQQGVQDQQNALNTNQSRSLQDVQTGQKRSLANTALQRKGLELAQQGTEQSLGQQKKQANQSLDDLRAQTISNRQLQYQQNKNLTTSSFV